MNYIVYILFRFVILIISILPFRVLYIFSDIISFIFYYILRYRRKVVLDNLKSSFPEKSEAELNKLTKRFYVFLTDIFIESLKGMAITKKDIRKRHKLINPEVISRFNNENRSVLGVTAHYGNWEWGAFSGANEFTAKMVAFYKPIKNKVIDNYMVKHRARFNCHLASISDTYFTFKRNTNEVVNYFMVADQSPSSIRKSHWVDFLNHDTPFLHGPDVYARLFNLPVVFFEIRRVKRGYYEVYFSLLTDNPASQPEGEVTRLFAKKLEEVIQREPSYWLWSHRRWKRTRLDLENSLKRRAEKRRIQKS